MTLTLVSPAQEIIDKFRHKVNGNVYAMAVDEENDIIYLGGNFISVGNLGTYGAALDPVTGELPEGYPQPNGTVYASCPDGSGGYYIGGEFTEVGNQPRRNLAHIDVNGVLTDWAKDAKPNATVRSLMKEGETIYVGGNFIAFDGWFDSRGASLDLADGQPDRNFPKVNGTINQVIPDGNDGWYIGGSFTKVGEHDRTNLAHINSEGQVSSFMVGRFLDQSVEALALDNETLYFGGNFTRIDDETSFKDSRGALIQSSGLPDLNFPKVDGTVRVVINDDNGGWYIGGDFSVVGGFARTGLAQIDSDGNVTSWNPNPIGGVYSLALSGETVYAGGAFTIIGGQSRNRLAQLNVSDGLATSWNPNADDIVSSMVVSDNIVYVAGYFTTIGGQSRYRLAAINVSDGQVASWNPNPNNFVNCLAVSGGTVYVGGNFSAIGGQSRNRIAAINVSDGLATSWNPNSNSTVNCLAVSGSTLYAGGSFTTIGGQSRNRIAELNVSDGMATSWNPNSNGAINSLALSGSVVYFGGYFNSVGEQPRNNTAAVNVSDGLVTSWNPNTNGWVTTMAVMGSTVYAGGQYTMIGGLSRNRIAAVNVNDGLITPWNPNAPSSVLSLAVSGGIVYAGGSFSSIGGQSRYRIAALEVSDGSATSWNPNSNNNVNRLEVSDGIVYACGSFTSIGGQSRNSIAALNVSDGLATAWNPNPNSTVKSLLVSGNTVYVGGQFTTIGGQPRNRIAAINVSDGLATNWNPDASGSVMSLAISGSTVYAGGEFTAIGGKSRNRIAALNVSDGLATSWNPNSNSWVYGLAVSGSKVYAGGTFTSIGGQPRNFLAALSESDGLATAWDPNPNNVVYSLAVNGPTIYLGGQFTSIGGQSRNYLAAVNVSDGLVTSWNPNATSTINSLALSGSTVYVGGYFSSVGGQARNNIAAVNMSDGLATSWNPNSSATVRSVVISGSTVYVGGQFTSIGGQLRNYLAALNMSDGLATSWNPNVNGVVNSLVVAGSTVYAGGEFIMVNGKLQRRLVALNVSDGLATALNSKANNSIHTLAVSGSTVYAGGSFTAIGGQSRNFLAALNVSDGLVTSWNPDANNTIYSLTVSGSTVYAGGYFTTINGQPRNYIAAIQGSNGQVTAWNPNANGVVYSLKPSGNTVYAGGDFTTIGGQPRNRIAALNVSDGQATPWNPNANYVVQSLEISGNTVYAGGNFTTIGGQPRDRIAAINTSDGLVTNWNPNANGIVRSLAISDNTVYAGGDFTVIGGQARKYIAAINEDGTTSVWNPNANNTIYSLIVSGNTIYAGGYFSTIGGQSRSRIAALNVSDGLAGYWNPKANGTVWSLIRHGSTVYAGGEFSTISDQTRQGFVGLTPSKTAQEISFSPLVTKMYGHESFALEAVSSSELELDFISSDPSILYIEGHTATILNSGSVDITASQAGDDEYLPAEDVVQVQLINKATLTVTADDQTKTYGQNNPTLTTTYEGFVNGDDVSDITEPAVNTLASSASTVGSYPITLSGGDATNYDLSLTDGTLTVEKASLMVVADDQTKIYGQNNPTLTTTYEGFVNGDDVSDITEPAVSTLATSASAVGSYPITLSGGDATNYDLSLTDGTLTVEKASLMVVADDQTKTYGESNLTLTMVYEGFVNGDGVSDITEPAVSTIATTSSAVGNYPITLSGGDATNYDLSLTDGTLTVEKASLIVVADDQTKTYGQNNPTLTMAYEGFVNGDGVSDITEPAVSTLASSASAAGNYPITLSGGDATNYDLSLTDGTLTVEKASLMLIADDQTKTYGESNPTLTTTYEGFVNGDDVSDITEPAVSTIAITSSAVGSYPITLSGGDATNYDLSLTDGTLTVEKASLMVVADDQTKTYGESNPTLTTTYEGFVNGDDVSDITEPAVSTLATSASSAGNYPITLSGGSATNYDLSLTDGTLTVEKASLMVVADDQTKTYGESNPTLTTTYEGFVNGDDVSDITEPAVSTLATSASAVGSYPITLSGGDATNYDLSLTDGTLTVEKASLMVVADDQTKTYGESNPTLTMTYEGFVNGDDVSYITEPAISTPATSSSSVGNYPIVLSGGTAENYTITYQNGTLSISPAEGKISLTGLQLLEDGTPKTPVVTTEPTGLNYIMTFDGRSTIPVVAGHYHVEVSIDELNYVGSTTATMTIEKVLGLGNAFSLKIYPNPTSKTFKAESDEQLTLRLFDLSGVEQLVSVNNEWINIESLSSGVYLIHVIKNDSLMGIYKLIKQ